ncbi:MAG: 30S ribosomal protein S13 [Candidatus Kerfeldbacteria bacterium RIFCSPHIGHO2_12_FULL_48_17]|uniref:Small ribosomal subunit protein uS13 n=1 Tax=Candidatus Kerfeldbacteria bacterium RIFCSPHIGHO2_12_FULL_48_17 TaxID=1798542 RepID=A0A1G2B0J0_9BACT|nr:MAG: 30S ribosomal protein S13 [Candidatus Kerfeldbacteria bacterium RIFCSPHIGHO2_12_FULL_48_17]
MARLAGVNLPKDKRIEYALPSIYGIGLTVARKILAQTGINPDTRAKDLTDAEVNKLREAIEKGGYRIEGELRRDIFNNIKRLKDISTYRGARHQKGLPVRGQRTKTNSRTRRGNVRRTTTSGRKKADQKT